MKKIIILFILILNIICNANTVYSQESNTNLNGAVSITAAKTDSSADAAIIAREKYKRQIMCLISANLPQKKKFYGKTVEVRLTLDKYGGLVNVDLTKSSGDTKYDQAAIASINGVMFPVFPPEVSSADMTLTYRIQCRKNIAPYYNSDSRYYANRNYSGYGGSYRLKHPELIENLLIANMFLSAICKIGLIHRLY